MEELAPAPDARLPLPRTPRRTFTRKLSIFQCLDNIPNSAGHFWLYFCRNIYYEHHNRSPREPVPLPGTGTAQPKAEKGSKADAKS